MAYTGYGNVRIVYRSGTTWSPN